MTFRVRLATVIALTASLLSPCGCTSMREYVRNGFKVGPNYTTPPAPVACAWIDAVDKRVRSEQDDLAGWWTVFNDPLLNRLMMDAYRQNLTLRQAGYRIMAARAQLGIATGEFFPQAQFAQGSYTEFASGLTNFNQTNAGFTSAWELDFWGRFRRAIASAQDALDASVFDYDDVLVTLLGDVASNYVQVRTTQERIRLLQNIVDVQQGVLTFIDARLQGGLQVTTLDRAQAESNLKQSLAQLDSLRIDLRVAQNQICILLGMPVIDLTNLLASAPNTEIPVAPEYVVVGIPADLLRRRPDVRRAERLAAAQAELVGIAVSDWYPAISVSGTLGWQGANLSDVFKPASFNSNMGPSFQWNLLNYGRILNNVRLQDARLQELVVAYQNLVLEADLEVENGIVTFLQSQKRAKNLRESVEQAYLALSTIIAQYEAGMGGGLGDFNRYALIQQTLVQQQDSWAQARGQIAQGLIQVYRSLGGGWQIRVCPPPDKQGILSTGPPVDPNQAKEILPPAAEVLPDPQVNPLAQPPVTAPSAESPTRVPPVLETGPRLDSR
jgi:NodT family efflux transporter outer membrane factor (OMF) lipoprotein